jgi:uncharacterized protein (DUF58 family)
MRNDLNPLPQTLQWNQLKIRPTRYGFVFMLLLLSMFVGSVNYNNNLGFLLTFLLGSMVFVSITHTYQNISGISILSCTSQPVFVDEQAKFELVAGGSLTHRNGIRFQFKHGKPTALDLPQGVKNHIALSVPATSRGVLKPETLCIFSDYPLGLFKVQATAELDCQCIVYPRPIAGKLETSAAASNADSQVGLSGPGADDFQGLKSYIPGDPLQRISWKASSRGRGLFTKEFNGYQRSSLLLDWSLLPGKDNENKLSLLCYAVLAAQQRNLTYGLKLPGVHIAPGKGELHKSRCLKTLALFNERSTASETVPGGPYFPSEGFD